MTGKDTEYWKARFELEEIRPLDPAFNMEGHIRILDQRIAELEDKVKTMESVQMVLVCMAFIGVVTAMYVLFT